MNFEPYVWLVVLLIPGISIGVYLSYRNLKEYLIMRRTQKLYEHVVKNKHLMTETEYMFEMYCIQYDIMVARGDKPIVKSLN